MLRDDIKAYLISKCIKQQGRYYSVILNLDSKSKKWQITSRALTRLTKTMSYQCMIDSENNIL